tara:strand:- start:1059 stop:1664 length:606 start_codon:yes stop_codon:yes gene_type:complete
MPRNGSGTYRLPSAAFTTGSVISSAAVNADFSDIAAALTGTIAKDGQTVMTGDLAFAGQGITMGTASITGIGGASGFTSTLDLNAKKITGLAAANLSTQVISVQNFPTTAANPGSVGFAGGHTMKFGSGNTDGSGNITVVFGAAFGTVCLAVVGNVNISAGFVQHFVLTSAPSRTQFSASAVNTFGVGVPGSTVYWQAFGY